MERFDFDTDKNWHYENGFYLTADITRIPKVIARYELYKKITHLAGHVAEFGVYKGVSFIQWLTFREILENQMSRKIIGFDMFGPFPKEHDLEEDKVFAAAFDEKGGLGIPVDDLNFFLERKKLYNYELIKGDITITLEKYLKENPHLRFSMIHIDTDVYEPTRVILDLMMPRMVKGGLILFDDYGSIYGETLAADENQLLKKYSMQKLSVCPSPTFMVLD